MTRPGHQPKVVLDASAVLAWVLNEPGRSLIDRLLPVGAIPAPNLTEVLYTAAGRGYTHTPDFLEQSLLVTGLHIEPIQPQDAVRAAELVLESKNAPQAARAGTLSLGDGICLAVAERLALPVTGGDRTWEHVTLTTTFQPFR